MRILGSSQFDQCVLKISLINLCNQDSYVGQQLQRLDNANEADEPTHNPWFIPRWFSIYVPHPDQEFEEITLAQGLTKGYNVEVKQIDDPDKIPYYLPRNIHFVVVLKQRDLNQDYALAATGLFIRPLAVLKLDIIDDIDQATYQPVFVKHPIVRDYPSDWQQKLQQYLNQEIRSEALPNVVAYVDRATNRDYRPPTWDDVYLTMNNTAKTFKL